MSGFLKRSLWTATLERYPTSFKEDRDRSSSLSRRPTRPFLRRPSTNGITLLQAAQPGSGATVTNLTLCAISDNPRVTRTRSRSSDALIPWRPARRHSFSGSQTPSIHARNHGLPLFTTPRGPQRGVGISTGLVPTEIPDFSLKSTFSPPLLLKEKPKLPTCSMCKYTIYNLECGHPGEDHVSGKDCPYFKETGVPCDRENPANRDRVSIKSEDRNGLCNKCRRQQREIEELEAMRRDEERAKQQSLVESKEREAAAKAHEERLYEESRKEFERLRREREQAELELMLQKSREEAEAEAARLQKEQEDLARALKASCVLEPADRKVTVEKKVSTRTLGWPVLWSAPGYMVCANYAY
jgi:hypothetical protein